MHACILIVRRGPTHRVSVDAMGRATPDYSVPHEESRKILEFAKMRDVTPNRCNTLVYAKWPPKTALVQERVALVAVLTSRDAVRALR